MGRFSSIWRRQTDGDVDQANRRDRAAEEEDMQRLAREQAFDAGLIGPGGVVPLEAGPITLMDHPDKRWVVVSHASDLNIPVVGERKGLTVHPAVMEGEGVNLGEGIGSQDSDPFDLLPIIEAVTKGGTKRRREEREEVVESADLYENGSYQLKKYSRSGVDYADATNEGSPGPQ